MTPLPAADRKALESIHPMLMRGNDLPEPEDGGDTLQGTTEARSDKQMSEGQFTELFNTHSAFHRCYDELCWQSIIDGFSAHVAEPWDTTA